jgi:Macrocin-O-methyltransferase (TylF)
MTARPRFRPLGIVGHILRRLGLPYEDGLLSRHNRDFLDDPDFVRAYARGIEASGDLGWRWRVHIGLWAASTAAKLPGDFVECGVNRGFLSTAIMEYLDWDRVGKRFWLLDTFEGIDLSQLEGDELSAARERNARMDLADAESVRAWFSQWQNVSVVEGPVPTTLPLVHADEIAYLHLDMNSSAPEVAALEYFWERLVPGAVVLFDDYGYRGYEAQRVALDALARRRDVPIASLPTGQGLLIRTA